MKSLLRFGRSCFSLPGRWLDQAFGEAHNPLRHLGALTIFFFWIVLVSGIWLFIFFKTSIHGAYDSVEYLTHEQWYIGGVMRSLHRYASDAAIVTLALHIAKEFAFDRYRGKRWFSWITGIPLLWMVIPLGITGYWLVWDQLAQYVALVSAEMLDALPIFTDSMARNFLSDEALSDRFFTLMAFVHLIGLPIFLVFGIWLHVFRIVRPRINPPRALMTGSLLAMIVLSLLFPALSQGEANLAEAPQSLGLDWYYLLVYPLMKSWAPGAVWALLVGFSLLILLAPWLPPAGKPPVARVDLDNCNGCERCMDDCPYGAVEMVPRSDGKSYESEAVVDPSLCVSCGICVGACPTATPFRRASALSPGIDLPDQTAARVRDQLLEASKTIEGDERIIVLGCAGSARLGKLADAQTAVVEVTCMAQVPPPFIDFVLSRSLADGVMLAGCAGGDCEYRLGSLWTEQRLARLRDPQLRRRVDRRRVALLWQAPWNASRKPVKALAAFRATLRDPDASEPVPLEADLKDRRWLGRMPLRAVAWALFAISAGAFSSWPVFQLIEPDEGIVSLTFSHAGQRLRECRVLSQEEMMKLPPNMRKPSDCPRERWPVLVEFSVDGESLYRESLPPSGLWNDGESTIYQRFTLGRGTYRFAIGMSDSGREEGFDYHQEATVDLAPGQHIVVEFDEEKQAFLFR
jgi:ferredoxin/coenzyme F420-reducing hydrogenase delta subunit